jgi:hypothetical protein
VPRRAWQSLRVTAPPPPLPQDGRGWRFDVGGKRGTVAPCLPQSLALPRARRRRFWGKGGTNGTSTVGVEEGAETDHTTTRKQQPPLALLLLRTHSGLPGALSWPALSSSSSMTSNCRWSCGAGGLSGLLLVLLAAAASLTTCHAFAFVHSGVGGIAAVGVRTTCTGRRMRMQSGEDDDKTQVGAGNATAVVGRLNCSGEVFVSVHS